MPAVKKNDHSYFYKEFEEGFESSQFSEPHKLVLLNAFDEEIQGSPSISKVSLIACLLVICVGFLGVIDPAFPILHFSPIINTVRFMLGAIAMLSTFLFTKKIANRTNLLCGAFLLILGVCGFVFGGFGVPFVSQGDNFLWAPYSNSLILGTKDHVFHILIGVLLLRSSMSNIKNYN